MRVAHISPSFHPALVYGGPTRTLFGLARATAAEGAEVRVLTTNANGPSAVLDVDTSREHLIEPRLTVRYASRAMPDSISPQLLASLDAWISWADVVHLTAVYSFPTIPTLAVCRARSKPLVWSPRGSLQRWEHTSNRVLKTGWERICRALLPSRTLLHATSTAEAEQARLRIPGLDAVIVPNGVDVPECPRHIAGTGALRLLSLGRLDPIKGLENLIDAFVAASASEPGMQLTIAGSGAPQYEAQLRERSRASGLAPRIRFAGSVNEATKAALLSETDVLVLASHSENFGLVAAEALAHGVPVIASRGTPWEALELRGCGLWVPNDVRSLADAILRARQLPLLEMGGRGRAYVREELGWRPIARRMLAAYAELRARR